MPRFAFGQFGGSGSSSGLSLNGSTSTYSVPVSRPSSPDPPDVFRRKLDLSVPNFSEPAPLSDVTLFVEDRPIHCSRYVLAKASPVFAAMFQADFKEKSTREIPLPDKNFDDMLTVIKIIHPPTDFSAINGENVEVVLHIADEYQMDHIINQCQNVMLNITTKENAMKYLWLAQEHGLRALYIKAKDLCMSLETRHIQKSEYFEKLDKENRINLLIKHGKLMDTRIKNCITTFSSYGSSVDKSSLIDILEGRKK